MWTFEQTTGRMYNEKGVLLVTGYAGRDNGKNNPAMENVKGIGPLPHGRYTGKKLYAVHPTVGKYAIQLEPDAETRERILKYGRNPDSFFFHGDSKEHPGLASHGCIVEGRPYREQFWEDTDRIVDVVPTIEAANTDAPTCRNCGSLMTPTGKCHTCPTCGTSDGCA